MTSGEYRRSTSLKYLQLFGVIVRHLRNYVEVREKTLEEYIVDDHSVFVYGHGSRNDLNKIAPFEASVEIERV